MDLKRYFNTFHGMKVEANFNRLITVLLLGLTIFLVTVVATRPMIVTIQPWTLAEDAQVTRSDASRSYLEAWGFALAELVGNVTPGNVGFVSDRLKPILDPKVYHRVLEALESNARTLVDERITMRFEPRRVTYEKSTGKVYVFGYSFVRHGTSFEAERREPRTYEFTMKIANYAPLLQGIDTYEGNPRTRDIIEKEVASEQKRAVKEKEKIREKSRYIEPKANTGLHTDEDRKL